MTHKDISEILLQFSNLYLEMFRFFSRFVLLNNFYESPSKCEVEAWRWIVVDGFSWIIIWSPVILNYVVAHDLAY